MDLKGIDNFKGINKRVDDAELAEGESPDSANAYFAKNKLQSLGPRKGRSFFNSSAYASSVRGIIPFRVTGMTPEIVLGLNDGSLRPVDAPFAYPLQTAPTGSIVMPLTGNSAVNITYPDTDENGSAQPVTGLLVTPLDILLLPRPSYGVSGWTESGGLTSTVTLDLRAIMQAGSVQDVSIGSIVWTRLNAGSTAGQAAGTPTGAPGSYGQSYVPVTLSLNGYLTGVNLGIDATYSNTASGTFGVSFSSTDAILIRGQIT